MAAITAPGYFATLRFLELQGWAIDFIFVHASAGGYVVPIDSTGITGGQVGAGGGAVIPSILADINKIPDFL